MENKSESSQNLTEMAPVERTSETSQLVPPNNNAKPSYLNIINNICALVFTGIITYCCFKDGLSLFSFHPTLMSIGVSIYYEHNEINNLYLLDRDKQGIIFVIQIMIIFLLPNTFVSYLNNNCYILCHFFFKYKLFVTCLNS